MRLFLDACAIIYWVEAQDPWYSQFHALMRRLYAEYPSSQIAVSALSRMECTVKPLREQNHSSVQGFEHFFNRGDLHTQALTDAVLLRATALRARHGLKTPDALQVASALECAQGHTLRFITNDQRLQTIPGLTVELIG